MYNNNYINNYIFFNFVDIDTFLDFYRGQKTFPIIIWIIYIMDTECFEGTHLFTKFILVRLLSCNKDLFILRNGC